MSFIRHNLLLIIIGVIIIGAVIWYVLSSSAPATPSLISTAATSSSDQQLVATLLALRAVSLDGTIFNDPTFLSLQDYSTQIVPEPAGRNDPFAPISAQSSATSSARGAKLFTPAH